MQIYILMGPDHLEATIKEVGRTYYMAHLFAEKFPRYLYSFISNNALSKSVSSIWLRSFYGWEKNKIINIL